MPPASTKQTKAQVKKAVTDKITNEILQSMNDYVGAHEPLLVGTVKPSSFVNDMILLTLYIWGPYSPKLYDGEFLSIVQDDFSRDFNHGVVIADNHIMRGKKLFNDIEFHVNVAKARNTDKKREREEDEEEEAKEQLTAKDNAYNKNHQTNRARVETVFSDLKTTFGGLNHVWNEGPQQHGNLTRIATAVHNIKKCRTYNK